MNKNFSLRERKKFQTRLSILNKFLNALENQSFHEIRVEDICDQANISKVTFFKYFSSKEGVLAYFVLRWNFQRSIEIYNRSFSGIEGIRRVFQSAADIPNAEKIFVSLINYYSKLNEKPQKMDLDEYDRYNILQNFSDVDMSEGIQLPILSLQEIFDSYLKHVKQLDTVMISIYSQQLIALFYGVPFHIHIHLQDPNQLRKAYIDGLDLIFKNVET